MPIKRRKSKTNPLIPQVDLGLYSGDNGSFLTRQLGLYLHRFFHRQSCIDRETLEFTCFVLGSERIDHLCDLIKKQLSFALQAGFEEDLRDAQDLDDIACAMARFLSKCTKRFQTKFRSELKKSVDGRVNDLETAKQSQVEANIVTVARIFGLEEDEQALLLFLLVLIIFDEADNFFISHLHCDKPFFRQNLATILGMNRDRLTDVLFGKLKRLEMIEVDPGYIQLNQAFIEILENPTKSLTSRSSFTEITDAELPFESHLVGAPHSRMAEKLLRKKPESPVHILFYGPPGTGKSSFARALMKKIGGPAYEIVHNEQNSTAKRRGALLSCIHFTNGGAGSVILVDEADNLLNTRFSWFETGETRDKGWVNHLLEQPGLRIIWIVNTLSMDESIYRRFTYSIAFHPFNRKQRSTLWKTALKRHRQTGVLTARDIDGLASRYEVSAGGVELAVRKAAEIGIKGRKTFEKFLDQFLVSHLTLMNEGRKPPRPVRSGRDFLVEGLNLDIEFTDLISGVQNYDHYCRKSLSGDWPSLNMLFYGPPGTGKSETGKYISESIDKELLVCKASDILDMYVGGTEQNLARIFSRAEDKESVLLIDEADSFLFDRGRAQRPWEISQTNEFLTQLENFRGIVICTTNRLPNLDSAVLRRFNRKIGFDYLTSSGKRVFYERMLSSFSERPLTETEERRLAAVPRLTPGDFKVVRDQHFLHAGPMPAPGELIEALEAESRLKSQSEMKTVAGFTAPPKMVARKIPA